MGCLACFRVAKSARVVPCTWSSSTDQSDGIPCRPSDTGKPRCQTREVVSRLNSILDNLLTAAGLAGLSLTRAQQATPLLVTAAQLPRNLASLQAQLQQACCQQPNIKEKTCTVVISELAGYLLDLQQTRYQQWHAPGDQDDCLVPSADALVNILNLVLFSQVTLDTAAVLHQRYQQSCDALASIGMRVSCLAACVQPANKATLAYLQLGVRAPAGELKVTLVVRRQSAFWDALQQLQQQHIVPTDPDKQIPGSLQLAKLFPQFVDELLTADQQEHPGPSQDDSSSATYISSLRGGGLVVEGGEGHGPRKEVFGLVGQNWTMAAAQQPALLRYVREPASWWFNTTLLPTAQLKAAYWTMGWLLAQAIINRATIGLQLAPLLFHRLLQPAAKSFTATLDMLRYHDHEAAQQLEAVLSMPQQQYEQLLSVEGQPAHMTKRAYVDQAVQQLLVDSVEWQYQTLRSGFYAVMDQQVLLDCCFTGHSLATAICGQIAGGESDVDIRQHYRVLVAETTPDVMGTTGTAIAAAARVSTIDVTVHCLWLVVDGWSMNQKRDFLKFITGSNSLPAKGSEQLSITFPFVAYGPKHQHQMLGMLPQSHTCNNTLELPNYAEALIATEPQLAEEWSEANVPRTHRTSSSHQMKGMEGLSRLVARCCAVLEDRLLVWQQLRCQHFLFSTPDVNRHGFTPHLCSSLWHGQGHLTSVCSVQFECRQWLFRASSTNSSSLPGGIAMVASSPSNGVGCFQNSCD